jgi:hypothetical protein
MHAVVRIHLFVLGAVAAGAIAGVNSAAAQDARPDRPYRGLFGPDGGSTGRTQFDLQWTALGGWDDNVIADVAGNADPRLPTSGGSWQAGEAQVGYRIGGQRAAFHAKGFGRMRRYPAFTHLSGNEGSGEAGFDAALFGSVRMSAVQEARYQPYYQFTLVPNLPASDLPYVAAADQALTGHPSHTLDGRIDLTGKLGRSSTFDASYGYRRTWLGDTPDPFRWQMVSGSLSKPVSRYSTLKVGYGYGLSQGDLASPTLSLESHLVTHNVDVGVAYARPLSSFRRTSFSFNPGTVVVNDEAGTHVRLLAVAGLVHEIGRTWSATLGYHRGVDFIEGFAGPTYADSVDVRFGGLVSRRVQLTFSSGYSNGTFGFTENSGGYSTYTESADMRLALSRSLSFVTRYDYYHHGFDSNVVLPFDIGQSLSRQSVRFGISGWVPFLR